MKKLRILVAVHETLIPPDSLEGHTEKEIDEWRTEYDVMSTLRAMGHDVELLADWDESVGHAGALIRDADGLLMGGFDPRSNGAVAAF